MERSPRGAGPVGGAGLTKGGPRVENAGRARWWEKGRGRRAEGVIREKRGHSPDSPVDPAG